MIRLLFPIAATAVALFLYLRRPLGYVGFTLWVWFLTPLARRLVDQQLGWVEPNLLLLAPFFVASVSGLSLILPRKTAPMSTPAPFVLCGLAVLYGFVVGMALDPSAERVYALFNWMAPMLFAMHLCLNWREYPALRRTIELNFAAGVAVMGAYGMYQFFFAPPWDTYWLRNISINSIDPSFGQPTPMGIRVWSTLNAPGPFANVMMAGLLLLFVTSTVWKPPASIAGYVSFLLSSVRTAWLSWAIGLVMLLRRERPATIVKIVASLLLLAACLVPVIENPNIAPVLGDRLKTFQNLHNDESFRERQEMYTVVLGVVRSEPWGHGLKNQEIVHHLVVDSGLLILVLELGWLGALLYAAGILSFLFTRVECGPLGTSDEDRFPRAMQAICIAYLAQLVGGQVFVGVTGAIFWMCLGMSCAARSWHQEHAHAMQVEPIDEALPELAMSER